MTFSRAFIPSLGGASLSRSQPFYPIIAAEGAARLPAYVLHELSAHAFPGQNGNDSWPETSGSQV